MSNVGNKYKVGVFVVSATVILIVSLVMLGFMNYFKPKYMFMTVLHSSVQGLEVGAKVKIKGVTIGKVTAIQIGDKGAAVYIYMEYLPDSLKIKQGNDIIMTRKDKYDYFRTHIVEPNVKNGMRCQLNYSGITGTLYQELGMYNPKKYPVKKIDLPPGHPPYIPSIPPVLIGNILKNLNKTLANTAQINLGPMIQKIETLAQSGNKLMNNKELKQLVAALTRVVHNFDLITNTVQENMTKKQFSKFVSNSSDTIIELNKTLIEAQRFMAMIDKELKAAQFAKTTESARGLMDSSSVVADDLHDALKINLDNLTQTINSANATLRSAKILFDSLEQNPSSVLYGKAGKRVIQP
jgi:ABC-type transporter Mla subunit MlaD